jgi:hypothetical protein
VTASPRVRTVALVVVVAAFAALAVFALLARAYEPGRNGITVPNNALSLTTPRVAAPASASYAADAGSAPAAVERVASASPATPAAAAPSAPAAAPAPDAPATLAPCEVGLAVPTESAGLANLVSLIPVFGPFSPEAFAMVPAFEPAFPLFGPAIIAGGKQLDSLPVDQVVSVLRPLENQGYDAIAPLYAPVRPQVLAGESQLAAVLQPGVAAFAAAPGATCLPAALAFFF